MINHFHDSLYDIPTRREGDLRGKVVFLDKEGGVGYVEESGSGQLFGLSRKFLGASVWALLENGTQVRFTDNGRNCAETLVVIK